MRSNSFRGAIDAPSVSPEFLQRSRISARVGVSESVADVLASFAYGADRRDHDALLVGIVADRTAVAGTVRQ